MQRNLVALLIASTLGFSGCCQTSPWSLVQKDGSATWSKADLDYVVQQEELELNLAEADRIRTEKEAAAISQSQESPGILSKVDPIDPAQFQDAEPVANKVIQLVSHTEIVEPAVEQSNENESNQIRARVPVANPVQPIAVASNPLLPKSIPVQAGTVESQVLVNAEPPSQLISHPLQPLALAPSQVAQQVVPQLEPEWGADDSIDNEIEVKIEQLPPMIFAAPPELPQRTNALEPMPQREDLAAVEWNSDHQMSGQIQLVGWEQEVEQAAPQQQEPQQSTDDQSPDRDEFTQEDFYAAGWCQQTRCQEKEKCDCPKVQGIATEFNTEIPSILPAQFQSQDGPNWVIPRKDLEFRPFHEPSLRVASAIPVLPGEKSATPTQLPIPIAGGMETEIVLPVSGSERIVRVSEAFRNAGFRSEVQPQPTPKVAPPLTWREHLKHTINTINDQVFKTSDKQQRQELETKLELLRLLPSELDEEQQRYLNALTELLQSTADPESSDVYQAGQTLNQLKGAVSHLESIAAMKVVNASFCSKVIGFGQFETVKNQIFSPGQTVLIYCEIENHSAQSKLVEGQPMSSTQLAASYIVYDANQKVVQQKQFPVVEDLARQRRRDFYMHLPFVVEDLPSGHYTYQLMVDDVGGGKSASLEPALGFRVK